MPLALVLDRNLNASAKLVWLVLAVHATGAGEVDAASVTAWSGLDRRTVRSALDRLAAGGWRTDPTPGPASARFPAALVADGGLSAQARILYGQLQAIPQQPEQARSFTYATLSQLTGAGPNTLKLAAAHLVRAGWLTLAQANRRSPIRFTLLNPVAGQAGDNLARARRRLARAGFKGEALMREYLSLLVDSVDYEDDAAPGFLVNPFTGERLELDRHYAAGVGFEFNGAQHYRETELSTWEETVRQVGRDAMKAFMCRSRGIKLVVVHPEDLSLAGMRAKVGDQLPLRDLAKDGPLIRLLQGMAEGYQAKAQ